MLSIFLGVVLSVEGSFVGGREFYCFWCWCGGVLEGLNGLVCYCLMKINDPRWGFVRLRMGEFLLSLTGTVTPLA